MDTRLHCFKYTDFTDKEELGRGDYGTLYAAKHPRFKKLAMRVVSRRCYTSENDRQTLRKEAEELFLIVSEQVIRLLGVVMEPEHLCLVYEYAEYGSLDKVLVRCDMPWPVKIRIAYEVALGMSFLHEKQILHLHLKCRNVLIAGNVHAKISDTCLKSNRGMNTWTRYAQDYSRLAQINVASGGAGSSIAHVPPELIRDINADPDRAADVYAYGIILWQILTNQTPYEGAPAGEICRNVVAGTRPLNSHIPENKPDVVYMLMLQCWDDQKQNRPSFNQVVRYLKPAFENIEVEARNLALACQERLVEFSFRTGPSLSAPEGDMKSIQRHYERLQLTHTENARVGEEGEAGLMTQNDQRVNAEPLPENHAFPQPFGGFVEECEVEPKNEDEPVLIAGEKSPRETSPNDLYKVAEELGRKWRNFGRNLGFTEGQLDNIEMNYRSNGYPEIPYQLLRQWKERNGSVTVAYLVKILKENDLTYIATRLDA